MGLAINIDKWKLLVAPGVEIDDFEKEHELLRMGIEYTFEMSGYELAPKFMVDFVEGDTVLIGGVSFFRGSKLAAVANSEHRFIGHCVFHEVPRFRDTLVPSVC